MQCVYLFYLYVLILNIAHAFNFFQGGNEKKCCKPDQILASTNSTGAGVPFKCVYDGSKSLNIETASFLRSFPQSKCIDVVKSNNGVKSVVKLNNVGPWSITDLKAIHFPKCCPIGYAYEPKEHSCIKSDSYKIVQELIGEYVKKGFLLVKPALSNCNSVIADYELHALEDIVRNITSELSLKILNKTITHGNYCFDEKYNSDNYVVRVCHPDFGYCRSRNDDKSKVKCIRKCCPDGKSYRNGKCIDNLFTGFSFFNNTRVKNSNESFAIIVPKEDCNKYMADEEEDDYHVDEKGYIRVAVVDNPPTYYSSFKQSYCFENVESADGKTQENALFICIDE